MRCMHAWTFRSVVFELFYGDRETVRFSGGKIIIRKKKGRRKREKDACVACVQRTRAYGTCMRVLGVLSIRAFWAASQLEEEGGVVLERTMKAGESRLGSSFFFFFLFFLFFPFFVFGFWKRWRGKDVRVCIYYWVKARGEK